MALRNIIFYGIMEYNVAQMSATVSLDDTYSGGPIFHDFLA